MLMKIAWVSTKANYTCGKYSLQAHTSGGIIGDGSKIQGNLISDTRILVKHSGFIQVILHGLKGSSNCLIQKWRNKALGKKKDLSLVLVFVIGFTMSSRLRKGLYIVFGFGHRRVTACISGFASKVAIFYMFVICRF